MKKIYGLLGIGVLVVVAAVWGGLTAPAEPVTPGVLELVTEAGVPVGLKGKLRENPPGTARVGYTLEMEAGEIYLDLSSIPRASSAAYVNQEVVVEGEKRQEILYNQPEQRWDEEPTEFVVVSQMELAE